MPALARQRIDLRRSARRASALPVLCTVVWALAWAAAPAQATTTIFEFNGEEQTFRVPGGVHSIHVVAIGGSGGASELLVPGGAAAQVTGDISVSPGNTIYVEVGGRGQDGASGGAGGFNGGATGGAGGGGASDIRTSPFADGLAPDPRLIVAAGGGGGGGSGPAGIGGIGGAAGENGTSGEGGNEGGGAGTAVLGGFGGAGCNLSGFEGQLGTGGTGGSSESGSPGGGGGGGYYGGGGGGGSCIAGSGGGGGGSSLLPVGGIVALASLSAAPEVQLTYTLVPPTISIVSPADGATYTKDQVVTASYSCTPPEGTTVEICEGPVANGAPLDTSTLGTHKFEVEGEDKDGAATEKSVSYTVVPAPPAASGSTSTGSPPPLPDTSLDRHPKETIKTKKKKVKVKFSFSSNVAAASFQCRIDKGKLESCGSPKGYMVKRGSHVFSVQAVSAGGTDPIPATFSFKVVKVKKKH
jgi:hypothetical protein